MRKLWLRVVVSLIIPLGVPGGLLAEGASKGAPPASGTTGVSEPGGAETSLGWLRSLAGDWEGTFEWSGARHDKGNLKVRYRLTGNGTAVVEDLIMGDAPSMTSVYHLDGPDLRMTHYCAAGNQPRLKATGIDAAQKSIHFDLVDVTNLKSPTAGHVAGVDLRLVDADRLNLTFTFRGSGAENFERIEVVRRPARS